MASLIAVVLPNVLSSGQVRYVEARFIPAGRSAPVAEREVDPLHVA